ncbi:MAG: SRPBCC family protein [Chloroflexota bacterium]|nr:SRPBCC family protein [Chloroflexota bacterium]
MGRYELSVDVPLPAIDAFRLWTDAGRYPQWQVGVIRVFDMSGPADREGTTLRLDFGPGMKRTTRVVEASPPERYVVAEEGMRSTNRTECRFELTNGGTRITVTYDLEVRLGPMSSALERLTRRNTLKTGRTELDRFAALAMRPLARPEAGQLYTVDGYAGFRAVKVIAVDGDVIHLALMPGVVKHRPDDVAELLDQESRTGDPLALRPLDPPLRRTASTVVVGQPLLALDGGHGVPHLAISIGAFTDALPEPAGELPIWPDETEEVVGWRSAVGPVMGRDLDTAIVPLVTVKDGERYGYAKLLHVERSGVHMRLYADRFDIPPDMVNPWALRLDRHDAPTMSFGHAPMSRATFAGWEPAYDRLVMRPVEDLEGYEMWKDANGGFF